MKDDQISRQAAIDAVRHAWAKGLEPTQYLEELPSAQPDLDEWCTDCKEYDHERHGCPRWNRVIKETLKDLQEERKTQLSEEGTTSDCISRQAAIDALVKAIREDPYYDSNASLNGLGVCDVRVIINDLPSAEPGRKKGKWLMAEEDEREQIVWVECSECGQALSWNSNYCPHCGAKMER